MTKQELEKAGYIFKIRQHEVKVFRTESLYIMFNGLPLNMMYSESLYIMFNGRRLDRTKDKKRFVYTIKRKHDPDYCLRKTIELATADWVLRRLST